MKTEIGILLLTVGLVVSLPLERYYFPKSDDPADKEEVKGAVNNDEVRVEVSHGSDSGTSGSITYSHQFYPFLKSLLEELAADPVVKKLVESNYESGRKFVDDIGHLDFPFKNSEEDEAFEKDESFEDLNEQFPQIVMKKNNEVRKDTQLNELYPQIVMKKNNEVRKDTQLNELFPKLEMKKNNEVRKDAQLNELFPKLEMKKNNEVRVEVKRDDHGTSGSITYSHRFPKL